MDRDGAIGAWMADDSVELTRTVLTHGTRLDHLDYRVDKHGDRVDEIHETTQILLTDARATSQILAGLVSEVKTWGKDIERLDREKATKDSVQWVLWFAMGSAGALMLYAWNVVSRAATP